MGIDHRLSATDHLHNGETDWHLAYNRYCPKCFKLFHTVQSNIFCRNCNVYIRDGIAPILDHIGNPIRENSLEPLIYYGREKTWPKF